jgi:hypothetical protein
LKVVVRSREIEEKLCRVSIYLLNFGSWEGQTAERASRFLYQPQIRVRLSKGARLQALVDWVGEQTDAEEHRLQMLYRTSPIRARGHMCAAVWREIDPEHEDDSGFEWIDGIPEVAEFQRCDVRTELMPMVTVPTPLADWRDELGPAPELEACALSETAQKDMEAALAPLVTAYERWLDELSLQDVPEQYKDVAREQIHQGQVALDRMRAGITLVATDHDAWLAFCWANRTVHEQAGWSGAPALRWRPFQLGFLLLCLPGLADPTSKDRVLCDLCHRSGDMIHRTIV